MGWKCDCGVAVLSGPGECPKCGRRLTLYKKEEEVCAKCNGKIRDGSTYVVVNGRDYHPFCRPE